MTLNERPTLKKELINLRQRSDGPLRNLARRTIRYIEKLESRLEKAEGQRSA